MAQYVRTEAREEEHDQVSGSWRFTHRGPFSVLKAGRKVGNTKVMKNVANTSVVKWGGRLLCLWEGGDPYEIEPGTLDTVGKFVVPDRSGVGSGDRGASAAAGTGSRGNVWDAAAGVLKPILHGTFNLLSYSSSYAFLRELRATVTKERVIAIFPFGAWPLT